MLRSIQFDRKLCPEAVKIYNIVSYYLLSSELMWIPAEKIVPKQIFFFGLVFLRFWDSGVNF